MTHILFPEHHTGKLERTIPDLLAAGEFRQAQMRIHNWLPHEVAELIESLDEAQSVILFRLLPRRQATEVFEYLEYSEQEQLIENLANEAETVLSQLINDLSADDRTSLLEELPGPVTQRLLNLLRPQQRKIATMLLGYPEDSVGRLMTPDYIALQPHWTIEEVYAHIRKYGQHSETLDMMYVVDKRMKLVDDITLREVLLAEPGTKVSQLLDGRLVALHAQDDQETAVQFFREVGRTVLPVIDQEHVLLGIVTIDDMLEVAAEEAQEDMQKFGGLEALETSYTETPFPKLVLSRARWLVVLFLGELLTATAMGYFEHEIAKAVILAMFVPLIISSGGNSGSQAATLIIRAMATGEVTLKEWWQVMRRELLTGLLLGLILGVIGFFRVAVWQLIAHAYGPHWLLIALTVGLSLIGVVIWGTLSGSMLPFVLRRLGADPASSSAPFVATLVDVTGLVIYFSFASLLLKGSLL